MELDKLIEYVEEEIQSPWNTDPNMHLFYSNMSRFLHGYKAYLKNGSVY